MPAATDEMRAIAQEIAFEKAIQKQGTKFETDPQVGFKGSSKIVFSYQAVILKLLD